MEYNPIPWFGSEEDLQIGVSIKEGKSWRYSSIEEALSMEVDDPSSPNAPGDELLK